KREVVVAPFFVPKKRPDHPKASLAVQPQVVGHTEERDRRPFTHSHSAHRALELVTHLPPVAKHHGVAWLLRVANRFQVGDEGSVVKRGGAQLTLEVGWRHPLTRR